MLLSTRLLLSHSELNSRFWYINWSAETTGCSDDVTTSLRSHLKMPRRARIGLCSVAYLLSVSSSEYTKRNGTFRFTRFLWPGMAVSVPVFDGRRLTAI